MTDREAYLRGLYAAGKISSITAVERLVQDGMDWDAAADFGDELRRSHLERINSEWAAFEPGYARKLGVAP